MRLMKVEDGLNCYVSPDGNWGGAKNVLLFSSASLTEEEVEILEESPEDFYDYMIERMK